MRRLLAVFLLLAGVASAQEGFPLDGTWRGQHQGPGGTPVTIVMVMQWDGRKITGVINPGPDSMPIGAAKLDPEGWHVTVSARTRAGRQISLDGILGEVGAYNRFISGTWTEGGRSYKVRMVRDS